MILSRLDAAFYRMAGRNSRIRPCMDFEGRLGWFLNRSVPENTGAVGLWLRQVDKNILLVVDVDGHVTIAGLGIVEPTRFSGTAAFRFGMLFAGCGFIP